jgi:glycosyltransferase involved in cell wall biosynthesis
VEGLVKELAAAGVDVRVLTTDADGPNRLAVPHGWHERDGALVRYLPRLAPPDLAPELVWQAVLASRACDVVHVTALFSVPSAIALAAARVTGVPVVFSPRGALEGAALASGGVQRKQLWLRALRPLLEECVFHATSEQELESVRAVFGAAVRVFVIPNGTTVEPAARAAERKAKRRPTPHLVVGALGRIHPIKALHKLIDAAALLNQRGLPIELRIAGPEHVPEYAEKLRRQVAELGLAGKVSFLPELQGEAKLDFLAGCDLLCLCSESENFGNVVVEALSSSTPVVASRGTPWQQLATHDCGAWVDNAPASLAGAIAEFALDRARVERCGERGRALVLQQFTWQAVAARMIEQYQLVTAD